MAPPPTVIPAKPLACYPAQGSTEPPPSETCNTDSVVAAYDTAAADYQKQCVSQNGDVADRNQALDLKRSAAGLKKLQQCDNAYGSLPVTAKRVGTMEASSPFRRLIPHLDKNGIDDFRSTDAIIKAAQDPDLVSHMKETRSLNILYPGSGSHMTPLGIAMKGIDQGNLDSAKLTYTEVDADSEYRVGEYLRFMGSPSQRLITDLKSKRKDFDQGHETTFSFKYKGKPVELVFALDRGGELWAQDAAIRESDLTIVHNSMYNNPMDASHRPTDRYIARLDELSKTDSRRRFVLSENQWDQKCGDRTCLINDGVYRSKKIDGFYGCGSLSTDNPTFKVVEGKLVRDDGSSPMKKHHVHPGPLNDISNGAVLLSVPSEDNTVDLKTLQKRGLAQNFEKKAIALDFDRNNVLSSSDFEQYFGRTVTQKYYRTVVAAIKGKDSKKYDKTLNDMETARDQHMGEMFGRETLPLQAKLRAYGIEAGQPIDLQSSDPITDENQEKRRDVARELAGPFQKMYESEFGWPSGPYDKVGEFGAFSDPHQYLKSVIESELKFGRHESLEKLGKAVMKSVAHDSRLQKTHHNGMGQEEYAEEQFNEYRQPSHLSDLEKKFEMDVRTEGQIITQSQARILGEALQFIKDRRPYDLNLLKTLQISNGHGRGMAFTDSETGTIGIYGPFGRPDLKSKIPGHYAIESQDSLHRNGPKAYIIQKLTHELGHLVATRDGKKPDGFDVPADYEKLVLENAHEQFAEDYSLYVQSDGKKVGKMRIDGQIVPNYEERELYFFQHYFLDTHIYKPNSGK